MRCFCNRNCDECNIYRVKCAGCKRPPCEECPVNAEEAEEQKGSGDMLTDNVTTCPAVVKFPWLLG